MLLSLIVDFFPLPWYYKRNKFSFIGSGKRMECEIHPLGSFERYRFVVVLSRYEGKILLSRHRERATWETQGGHIEPGETPLQAARRELFEESGAARYEIRPLFDYSFGGSCGVVFGAEILELGSLPESEMAEVKQFDDLPENITYPQITPYLFREQERLSHVPS